MIPILSRLPEGRAGQALAIAAPVVILVAVIIGFVQPALQWYSARQQQLAAEQEQIAHILALRSVLPQLRQQASAAAAASSKTQILLAGNSDSIAEANLQSALNALARSSGANLTSAAVLPGQMVGSLRRVGIQLDVNANWLALTELLESIDSAHPRMIVDDLSISNSGTSSGVGDTLLQASFAVSAFRVGNQP